MVFVRKALIRLSCFTCAVCLPLASLSAAPAGMVSQTQPSTRIDLPEHRLSYQPTAQDVRNIFLDLYPTYQMSHIASCGNSPEVQTKAESFYLFRSDGRTATIEVRIERTPEVNAYAIFEGQKWASVVLTEGLLQQMQSESELAFVLAHEMAHIESGHAAPHGYQGFFTSAQLAHIAGIHRKWEFEADMIALLTLRTAGYQASSAYVLLDRLRHTEEAASGYLQKHPSIESRVEMLQSTLGQESANQLARN